MGKQAKYYCQINGKKNIRLLIGVPQEIMDHGRFAINPLKLTDYCRAHDYDYLVDFNDCNGCIITLVGIKGDKPFVREYKEDVSFRDAFKHFKRDARKLGVF